MYDYFILKNVWRSILNINLQYFSYKFIKKQKETNAYISTIMNYSNSLI